MSAENLLLQSADRARQHRPYPTGGTRPSSTPTETYSRLYGWRVVREADIDFLVMGAGLIGVAVPAMLARRAYDRLARSGNRGPILRLDTNPRSWLFLADPNGEVLAQSDLPFDVKLWNCPSRVPLPSSSCKLTCWVVPPHQRQRWLPTLAAVVAATKIGHCHTARETPIPLEAGWLAGIAPLR